MRYGVWSADCKTLRGYIKAEVNGDNSIRVMSQSASVGKLAKGDVVMPVPYGITYHQVTPETASRSFEI